MSERPQRVDVLVVGGSPGLTSRSSGVLATLDADGERALQAAQQRLESHVRAG